MGQKQEVKLQCRQCGYKFSEWIELPMRAQAFIARGKGWNVCPECGSKKIDMVGGAFMVPDLVQQ